MGWVLFSTLTLLGFSFCNGMGAVEHTNPIDSSSCIGMGAVKLWKAKNEQPKSAQIELSNGMGVV